MLVGEGLCCLQGRPMGGGGQLIPDPLNGPTVLPIFVDVNDVTAWASQPMVLHA